MPVGFPPLPLYTADSVLFVGPTGLIVEDNANFSWNTSTHSLKIGSAGVTFSRLTLTNSLSNVFIALGTGNSTATGTNNVGVGESALSVLTSGSSNIALGVNAGTALTSGGNNVALGFDALQLSATGTKNFALGTFALQSLTSGGGNVAIGYGAIDNSATSSNNVGIGNNVLNALTSGSSNTMVGAFAGDLITSGNNNTLIGGWEGPSSALSSVIALSDGAGNLKLDYNYTTSSRWTFVDSVAVPAVYINVAAFMLRSTTAWTDGAAAAIGTLTNAPAAGNPTKWIAVDDNGTTRYIPAW